MDKLVHLTINGEEIVTTDNHPFYVQGRGFIEETAEPVDVYNFQVEDYRTYLVGECAIWLHNAEHTIKRNGIGKK